MSDLAVATTSSSSMSVSQSQSMKSSFASSTSYSATGSTTTKSSTTVKSTKTVKTSKTSMTSTLGAINIKSGSDTFAHQMGIDLNSEMAKLQSRMDEGMGSLRREIMHLMPLERSGTGSELVKLDNSSISNYIDKAHKDTLSFNFDVDEFESESITVNAVGNKIEVHAKKKSKKGDEEKSEEYCRTYELPTASEVDSNKVTSSFYKDGVLTVQLPLEDATKA